MNLAFALVMVSHMSLAAPGDTLVVCPAPLRPALEPWLKFRAQQGREFVLIEGAQSPEAIRSSIRRAARKDRPRFILLVGDADAMSSDDPVARARSTPTHYAKAKVTPQWGSEPEIADDTWYADLDDDGLPDAAIGRLSVDSSAELTTVVRKMIAYEQNPDFGPWRRRVNLVAGVGGFGAVTDGVLEMATRRLIDDGIPAAYQVNFTQASWQSPFCPDPRDFRRATIERLNEGSLFWVYVGHGNHRGLDFVRAGNRYYPIFMDRDTRLLGKGRGESIACFLACYVAAFDADEDCLAELMLRQEGGPVAVLGGTRVTMPYATALLASELLDQIFHRHATTLGEAILEAKRSLVAPTDERQQARAAIDTMALLLSPKPGQLADERAEHLALFALIGDPLLSLHYPGDAPLEIEGRASAGEKIVVHGRSPIAGHCVLELVAPRGTPRQSIEPRVQFDENSVVLAQYNAVYRAANDPCWSHVELDVPAGEFRAEIAAPPEATGDCQIRAFIAGRDNSAAGSAAVTVEKFRGESRPQTDINRAAQSPRGASSPAR